MSDSRVADRQIQELQYKIQQKIILYDEQINKYTQTLSMLKSSIVEKRRQIQYIDDHIVRLTDNNESSKTKRVISLQSQISKLQVNHAQFVQKLQEQQAAQIEKMQKDFQGNLSLLTSTAELNASNAEKLMAEIDIARENLECLKTTLVEAKAYKDSVVDMTMKNLATVHRVDTRLIDELKKTIENRNQERIKHLMNSKQKLAQCCDLLEELERNQEVARQQRREKLKTVDDNYLKIKDALIRDREIEKKNEQHRLDMARKLISKLNLAATALNDQHQNSLRNTIIQLDEEKLTRQSKIRKGIKGLEIINEVASLKESIESKKKLLKQREKLLSKHRTENNELHSMLQDLKHRLRYGDM